eukprot:476791-Prorocentrum_minimum.AAC.3
MQNPAEETTRALFDMKLQESLVTDEVASRSELLSKLAKMQAENTHLENLLAKAESEDERKMLNDALIMTSQKVAALYEVVKTDLNDAGRDMLQERFRLQAATGDDHRKTLIPLVDAAYASHKGCSQCHDRRAHVTPEGGRLSHALGASQRGWGGTTFSIRSYLQIQILDSPC